MCHSWVLLKTARVFFLNFHFIELQINVPSHLKLITSLPLKKKKKQPTFRKLVCGFLQFVPHKTAHQQYSSKELAHSYKCVFKLKGYAVLLFLCCAAIMEGKYFHRATKITLTPRKAVATSYLLYKTVNRERSHGRVIVGSMSRAWCDSPFLLQQPVLNLGLTSTATALVSPLACPPFVREAKCMQEPHKIHIS